MKILTLNAMRSRPRQRGQAMIETIVAAALVLVPLFLAIPVIAKYQDIRSHVVQGARYAAWERTVWFGGASAATMGIGTSSAFSNKWDANEKTDDSIRAEIGTRILSKNISKFDSGNDQSGTYRGGAQGLWQDRRGNSLLQDYSDISAGYTNKVAPGLTSTLLTPLLKVAGVVSNFTLDTHAKYTASLGLSVKQVAFNPDVSGLGQCTTCPVDYIATSTAMNFSEKNVLVANGWSANGPGSLKDNAAHPERITVYNQIRGLTPTSILKPSGGPFKTAMDVLNVIALIFFPELSTLDLGRIEVDKVPADRLK